MLKIWKWGPERWLSTLRYHARHDVEEWRRNNPTVRELRYNPLQSLVIWSSQHLVLTQISLFIVGFMATVAIVLLRRWLPEFKHGWTVKSDPAALLNTVWTVQVTLAAVVYPIVIGFISLLFQQRASSAIRMTIFLNDSGAKVSGLSSLLLCLIASIQWALAWAVNERALLGWVIFDTVWLGLNTLASIYFLYRTFEVLQVEKAERIIQRYAVDVLFRREVHESLLTHVLMFASNNKLLPDVGRDDARALMAGKPSVLINPLMIQSGEACVSVESQRPQEVRDVRLRLLGWAINSWLSRAKATPKKPGKERGAALYLPAMPAQRYNEVVDLCRFVGSVPPNAFERRLIRAAYSLSRYRDQLAYSVSDLLEELSKDVLEDIEKRQHLRAKDRLDAMSDFHAIILNAGAFLAGRDNYALLSEYRLMNMRLHDGWIRTYLPILEASAAAVGENTGYFSAVAHLPMRLFLRTQTLRNETISDRLITLGRTVMLKLGHWWTGEVEKQGRSASGPCAEVRLDPRNGRNYAEALRLFIGAWESMGRHYFAYNARRQRAPWADLKLTAHFQLTHLGQTVLIAFDALARGDVQCAAVIADSLGQWKPAIDLNGRMDHFLVRTPFLLTMTLMEGEEADLQADVELSDHAHLRRDLAETVMAVVFDNLWTDFSLVAAYSLAHWSRDCPCEGSLALKFVPQFLRRRSDSPSAVKGILGQIELDVAFWAMIRQHFGDPDYRAKVNALVEKIEGIRDEPMISGRIYTHVGVDDLDSLRDAQLIVLCLLIRAGYRAENGHDRYILKLLNSHLDRAGQIDLWLTHLIDRLRHDEYQSWAPFFRCQAGSLTQALGFDDAVAETIKTLESFRKAVQDIHARDVQIAPIDEAEIDLVAEWATKTAFAKDTGAMPVSLFTDIRDMPEDLPQRHVAFNRLNRGEFTNPKRSTRPSGEDDHVANSLREIVGAYVLNEAIVRAQPRTEVRKTTTPEDYWRELSDAAKALRDQKLSPVLIVENLMAPSWIHEWSANWRDGRIERPKDLHVTRRDGVTIPEYIAHFNDIAVYSAQGVPPGSSFLFAREDFHKLEFTKFENRRLAKATWTASPGAPTQIDLKISYGQRVNLGMYQVFRLKYGEPEPAPADVATP